MIIVGLLGVATMVLVMWEKFSRPEYRTLRAIVFVSLGLLSALPTIHVVVQVSVTSRSFCANRLQQFQNSFMGETIIDSFCLNIA